MRKITPEEIEQLYQFTQKHYVEYYDVQTELVDHLGSAMEERWEEAPGLSFEENLQREFSKFGVLGFSEVVKKKRVYLEKQYFRLIWKEIRLQVSRPAGFFSFLVIFFGFLLLLNFGTMEVLGLIVLVFLGLVLFFMLRVRRNLKQKRKRGQRIYLLEFLISNVGAYFSVIYIPFQIFIYSDISETEIWQQELWVPSVVALVFTALVYFSYICLYHLPKKKDLILKEQYPELKI